MAASLMPAIHLPRIAYYPGAIEQLRPTVNELVPAPGTLALACGARTRQRLPALEASLERLKADGWSIVEVGVSGEPSDEWIDRQRERLPDPGPDLVVAVGGGSVLDAGKALAAMACESGPTRAYLEGVGDRPPSGARAPWIAVPTTMGTGSEATYNAVLGRPGLEGGYKRSLRHERYVADWVLLDAGLTASLPRAVVITAGMDAFSQLLESYLAPTSTPLLDRWIGYGLELAGRALPRLMEQHGEADLAAERHDMALAATLSGVALTGTGLGTVHGLIGPLGAVSGIPHGSACANVLPAAMRHTLEAARAAGGEARSLVEDRMARTYTCVGDGAGMSEAQRADALVDLLERWRSRALRSGALQGLDEQGVGAEHIEAVVSRGSDRRNPVAIGPEGWRAILEAAR